MEERRKILKKMKSCSPSERHKVEDEVQSIENEISEEQKSKQIEKLQENLNLITDNEGKVSVAGAWKLRKKIFKKPLEQLSSKKDKDGNILTDPDKIKC